MGRKMAVLTILCGSVLLLSASVASATTIGISLASPDETATTGDVLSFMATISNSGASSIYLNADSHTEDAGLTVDDSPFFSNFPISLNPGDSATAVLFAVTVTGGPGVYSGFFDIQGGTDPSALDVLGDAPFKVTVTPAAQAVPEPSTILLMATGVVGLIRRRKA
jgi:PEP-CTERM motif-containing protein